MTGVVKVGGEILLNSPQANSWTWDSSQITSLANGDFVIAWAEINSSSSDGDGGIYATAVNAAGEKITSDFLVNTQVIGAQYQPTITGLINGGFIISWIDGSNYTIQGQIFNNQYQKIGNQFTVYENYGDMPKIAGMSGGGFVVTWSDNSGSLGDSSDYGVRAQIFKSDGSKCGGEFLVNTETKSYQIDPSIAAVKGDKFVITWRDYSGTAGASSDIKGQIFDENGVKIGGEFLVNTESQNDQADTQVAGLTNGGFVVAWVDGSGGPICIKAQIFLGDGTKVGSEFVVNPQASGSAELPSITAMPNGGFIVSWTGSSGLPSDGSGTCILAQIFSGLGVRVGDPFVVNTQLYNDQASSEVSVAQGKFAVTWADYGETVGNSITGYSFPFKVQVFSLNEGFYGTTGIDALSGADGDDVINGLGGIDSLDGKDGSDIYLITGSNEHKAAEINDTGTSGTDEVRFSAAKSDTLKIFAGDTGIERVVIGTGTDVTADSSGTLSLHIDASKAANGLTIVGNAGVNKLTGTAFADAIDGGAGADKMTGGAGDDTYVVDNVKDAIAEKATGGTDIAMASVGYKLASNVENLTLTGSANIGGTGNSGANTIVGNSGNNTLNAGLGNDTLTGGVGADTFVLNTKPNAATNVDTITDFSSSDGDHLQFSLKLFKALGAVGDLTADQFWSGAGVTTAHDSTDRLIYNTSSGDLYYDVDGTGAKAAVLVAHLSGSPSLSYADIQIIA